MIWQQRGLRQPRQGIKEFSYADLAIWASEHREVPQDNNEPFVISDLINVNDDIPESSIIRIAISTKNMIGLAKKRKHICADATYKLTVDEKHRAGDERKNITRYQISPNYAK